jgi:hypothetical protein
MQRVLFWLAIGMLGTAVPASAAELRISNCMTSNRQITAFNGAWCPTTGVAYSVPACGTVVLGCATCKIGIGSQTCVTAATWSSHRTFGKNGIVETSMLDEIVRTKNEPEQEWRWEWPPECECAIDSMQW